MCQPEDLPVRQCALVEQAFQKARMECRRADVYATADVIIPKVKPKASDALIRGMNEHASLTGMAPAMLAVHDVTSLLLYRCTEGEALERLAGVRRVQRTDTPKRVLYKMLIPRIRNVMEAVGQANTNYDGVREGALASGVPSLVPDDIPQIPLSSLANVQKLVEAVKANEAVLPGRAMIVSWYLRGLHSVLEKNLMDDEVMAEAWKVFQVEQVLNA